MIVRYKYAATLAGVFAVLWAVGRAKAQTSPAPGITLPPFFVMNGVCRRRFVGKDGKAYTEPCAMVFCDADIMD